MKPEETGTNITSIRQTKNGEILLELGRDTKDLQALSNTVKTTLGKTGAVRKLVPRMTLELLDLDSTTTREEVEQALRKKLEEKDRDMKVTVTKPNGRGQVIAFVEISEQMANILLKTPRIKVGWVNSRIRLRI